MADALNLKMIVEGVESDATVKYLQSIGVHYIQGHFFSEASPAGVCQLLLQESVSLFN
jgi:sensor c-di-GMP phosphodiesterase-like protein